MVKKVKIWIAKKENKEQIAVVMLYVLLYLIITYFHEPWFDEAQAWQIGKCASYKDMLFVIPHTEGHPPLWSLILSIPAKVGVPYLIGLKGTAFLISLINIILIEFKSPFSKWVKYVLPFTYYLFYQYGVISRNYSIMTLAIIFVAITFKDKDIKPIRFCLSCLFLCLTSAYGILIAGGICAAWFVDIFFNKYKERNLKIIYRDGRIIALFLLFLCALIICLQIRPYADTAAVNSSEFANISVGKVIYMFLALIGDSMVSVVGLPLNFNADISIYISGVIVTVLIYCIICKKFGWKYLIYLWMGYVPFAIFGCMYLSNHHMGIPFLIILLILWIGKASQDKAVEYVEDGCVILNERIIAHLEKGVVYLCIGIMMLCNIVSSVRDISTQYCSAQKIAELIKQHNMEEALIMCEWSMYKDIDDSDNGLNNQSIDDMQLYDTNAFSGAVQLCAYFNKNIFMNFNADKSDEMYLAHIVSGVDNNKRNYELWSEKGVPEVIIGNARADLVYGSELNDYSYLFLDSFQNELIFKCSTEPNATSVKIREDCLEKYDFLQY